MTQVQHLPSFTHIKPEQIEQQLSECLANNKTKIAELLEQTPPFTWNNLMTSLDDLDDKLHQFWSPISHLHSVMSQKALRKAYQQCLPKLSEYSTEIGQNSQLFHAIESITESADYKQLDEAQQKVIQNELRDFRLAGVALDDKKKQAYKQLQTELSQLTNQFEEHILDATDAWSIVIDDENRVAGIPQHALTTAKQAAQEKQQSGWLFNLEFPSYYAVITYADDAKLRETIYHAYVTRASEQGHHDKQWDNSKVMVEIIKKRHELAQLLGFAHYGDYSLARKMADSSQQVMQFLEDLVQRCKTQAAEEFKALETFAQERDQLSTLNAWDIPYYSEKLRQHRYQVSQEELRPYFPENNVIKGLFTIANKLYGLHIKPVDNIDTWHEHVKCYAIYDEQNHLYGHLYTDLYARAKKRSGAWMDDCAARRRLPNQQIQTPIAFLTCNFAAPTDDTPALLTHDDVVTLFHEFGHCLHHLLTQVDYLGVSGINGVAWDAVELPSQFFENWCWQKEGLDIISGHYQHGKTLPQELIDKLIAAKNFNSAMMMLRQLEFSLFDFRLHSGKPPQSTTDIQALLNQVRREVAVVPVPEFNRFQHSFSHIFAGGYAAGYYSYKWAEVLAADAFSKFEENGIFDEKTGREFLENILQKGGSRDAMDLFVAFRGRKPTIDALLRQCGIQKQTV